MRLRPLNDNLILLPDEEEIIDQTLPEEVRKAIKSGKIILPEKYQGYLKKMSYFGKLVSWGDRCHYDYREGEKIWFGQFAYTKLSWQDKWLWIISERDAHAKVEDA